MYTAIRHPVSNVGASSFDSRFPRIGRPDPRLRQAVLIGIAPLAAAAAYAVLDMTARSTTDPGLTNLALSFGLLFAVTLSFAYYVFVRFSSLHQPPFIWACLLILESLVSPLFDWIGGTYPLNAANFVEFMPLAVVMCALFTVGLWIGAALWLRRHRSVQYPLERATPNTIHFGAGPLIVFLALGMISLAAEIFIIVRSGVLVGDLNDARTLGLVGTAVLQPLVRLTDIGCLLASWASLVATGPRVRRQYFAVGIFRMLVAMIMPALLQRRFGLCQGVLYFILPRVAVLTNNLRSRRLVAATLPVGLVLVYGVNEISSTARSFLLGGRQFTAESL